MSTVHRRKSDQMWLMPSRVWCLVVANRDPVADVNTDWLGLDKEMESRADYSSSGEECAKELGNTSLCSIQYIPNI